MQVQPRQTKSDKRKKALRKGLIVFIVIALALLVLVLSLRRRVSDQLAADGSQNIQTAQVTAGSIRTTVSGSGTLVSEGLEDVMLPANVELEKMLVEAGDPVQAGDTLAAVKVSSVRAALSNLQDQLDELDGRLRSAASDKVSAQITAGVAGRVKGIYAQAGDDVGSAMQENGCLALLSLDGFLALSLEDTSYQEGDSVQVTASDGTIYSGTVSYVQGGTVTVLVPDDGPKDQEEVTVDGQYTGKLFVHKPLKVTGFAGTVSRVNVAENASVSAYTVLFNLTDTEYTANYESVLEQRAELEDTMRTLIQMYREGVIVADMDGIVDSIPMEDGDRTVSQEETVLLTLDPNREMHFDITVDETDILSLAIGQQVTVEIESAGDAPFTGTVCRIDTTATGSGSYTATVSMETQPGMLPGMTAEASVTIQGVENALLLPEDAVRRTSTSAYVYTAYDPETGEFGGMREVAVGLSNGSYVEITQGLSQGDTVYYEKKNDFFAFDGGEVRREENRREMPEGGPGGEMGGGHAPMGGVRP